MTVLSHWYSYEHNTIKYRIFIYSGDLDLYSNTYCIDISSPQIEMDSMDQLFGSLGYGFWPF